MDLLIDTRVVDLGRPYLTARGPWQTSYAVGVTISFGPGPVGQGFVRCRGFAEEAACIARDVRTLFDRIAPRLEHLVSEGGEDAALAWRQDWIELAAAAAPGSATMALAGVDAAMWELLDCARFVDPIGPNSPADVGIYWSGLWIGDSAQALADEARMAVAEGFDGVKMRIDIGDVPGSAAAFAAIASAVPDQVRIAVEVGQSGTVASVKEFLSAVDRSRVLWIEDPVPSAQIADLRQLSRESGVAIGAGETIWGVRGFLDFVEATEVALPIVDFAQVGGPSGVCTVLTELDRTGETVGLHLDERAAIDLAGALGLSRRAWIEVMGWWSVDRVAELRGRLVASDR